MSDDAWIQQSLERLEGLETHKAGLESQGLGVPQEIEAEISALYETLNHAAGGEQAALGPGFDPAAQSHAALSAPAGYGGSPAPAGFGPGQAAPVPQPGFAPAPFGGAAPIPQPTAPQAVVPQPFLPAQPPFGQPQPGHPPMGNTAPQGVVPQPPGGAPFAAQAAAPFVHPGAHPGAQPGGYGYPEAGAPSPTYDTGSMGSMMLDAPKSKAPMVLGIVAAVAVVGGGGFFVMQNSKAEAPAAPAGEASVIGASSVPDDTEEPDVAQGADVSRTQGTRFKEGSKKPRSGGGGKRTSGGSKRSDSGDKDSGHKLKISDDSRDPLAGLK